jgi:antitoxin VapB
MSLNIKDARTHQAVRRLADLTGETMTEAVRVAVPERLRRVQAQAGAPLVDRLNEIALHCADGPIDRSSTDDEILGHDAPGLPD